MASIPIETFYPLIRPSVLGCPDSLIEDAVRNACIRFSTDTWSIRETLNPIDVIVGTDAYSLSNSGNWDFGVNTISLGAGGFPTSIAGLSFDTIAFITTDGNLKTFRLSGTGWALIGNAHAFGTSNFIWITALNSTDIALIDGLDNLETWRFDGTNWAQIGNTLSLVPRIGAPYDIASLDESNVVVYRSGLIETYRWDGVNWNLLSSQEGIIDAGLVSITAISENKIAAVDALYGTLATYSWDGSSWSLLGEVLNINKIVAAGFQYGIATINETSIAIAAQTDGFIVYKFDGLLWSVSSETLNLGVIDSPAMVGMSSKRIAFFESANKDLILIEDIGENIIDIVGVISLLYDSRELDKKTEEELDILDSGWRTADPGIPNACFAPGVDRIQLNRKPNTTIIGGIVAKVATRPSDTAKIIEEKLFTEWRQAIKHGALEQLLEIPEKGWSNLQQALWHGKNFNFEIQRGKARTTKGNFKKSTSARMRAWI